MDKIKNYLIIGLSIVIMVLLLLKGCDSNKPSINKPIYIKGKDSIRIDTIPRPYEVIKFKPIYYPKWDTSYIDTSNHFKQDGLTREYNDSLSDKNLTIFSYSKVLGIIKQQKLSYRLKVPLEIDKTIKRVDTLKFISSPKFSIYTGLEIGGNKQMFNISPFLSLNVKNNVFIFRYGVLDKSLNLGVGLKIYNSKR